MTISRRSFLNAVLAAVAAAPFSARAADSERVDYTGPDDVAAYDRFVKEQSVGAVVVNVFHATWCGPCRALFGQLDDISRQPGVTLKVIGLDVGPPDFPKGPYKNIIAAHQVKGTPQLEIFAGGKFQHKMMGSLQDVGDTTRYLQQLTRVVHGRSLAAPKP